VPSRERVRADQEALPPVPGQDPSRRCEERPIRRGEEDSPPASAEDLELVVEHDGLKIQLLQAAADEHSEQPAQKRTGWTGASGQSDAGSAGLRTARSEWPIEFLYPTGAGQSGYQQGIGAQDHGAKPHPRRLAGETPQHVPLAPTRRTRQPLTRIALLSQAADT